jgi:MFS transporter, DHA2 family, multidrug resistance protein
VAHVTVWDPETQRRLGEWTRHFLAQGADAFTAQRQATAMLYHDVVGQAQVLAYADDFWILAILFSLVPLFLPLMRRVHADPAAPKADDDRDGERVSPLPAPVE